MPEEFRFVFEAFDEVVAGLRPQARADGIGPKEPGKMRPMSLTILEAWPPAIRHAGRDPAAERGCFARRGKRVCTGSISNERGDAGLTQTAEDAAKREAEAAAIAEKLVSIEAYRMLLNGEERVSDWLLVDQRMIDTFADATHDHQFIHVDPERARAETPFGGTIAHGFLTLSLLSRLAFGALPGVSGTRMGINYGFDKVRFVNTVRSGARVRGRFRLVGLTERAVSVQSAWEATVEIEGAAKPALSAHWITLAIIEPPA